MMTRLFPLSLFAAFVMLFASVVAPDPAAAQAAGRPLQPEDAFALSATKDADGDLTLQWVIADGYYLYRSSLLAQTNDGTAAPMSLPDGEPYDDPYFGAGEIFRHSVRAKLPALSAPVTVNWQGCQADGICYAPQSASLSPDGVLSPGGHRDAPAAGETSLDWSPQAAADPSEAERPSSGRAPLALADDNGVVEGLAHRGGAALVVLGFFGFGLLLAFTPCVLPMFPIVAGMLARQGKTLTAGRGLVLTGAYVLAMAVAFGTLGVAAAWSGANLQVVLQSPWTVGVIALVFAALALSMFGFYDLQMPAALQRRFGHVGTRRGSVGGAALLGFTSALIVGPCVTAPLAGALLYIAQTGDVVLGAAALFALGLGQGVPLLAVGVFGPRILPRNGAWMERVKQAFGVVFLGLAIWLAGRVLPGPVTLGLWAALLIGVGVFLGGLDRLDRTAAGRVRLAAAVGIVLIASGLMQGVGAAMGATDPLRPLALLAGNGATTQSAPTAQFATVYTVAQLDQQLAATERQPALVYVTADWCVTCRAIERGPLADPDVTAALAGLALIKVDVSDFDGDARALMGRLAAAGPPTMVFLDADRAEAPGSRLTGDVDGKQMIASLEKISP